MLNILHMIITNQIKSFKIILLVINIVKNKIKIKINKKIKK
jgi:hypothetical protein